MASWAERADRLLAVILLVAFENAHPDIVVVGHSQNVRF
jgi:hypothetical protein